MSDEFRKQKVPSGASYAIVSSSMFASLLPCFELYTATQDLDASKREFRFHQVAVDQQMHIPSVLIHAQFVAHKAHHIVRIMLDS